MLRNVNPPTFNPDRFDITINYDDPVGSRIIQVQAADGDQVSISTLINERFVTGDKHSQIPVF